MGKLSHTDGKGRAVMLDVSAKKPQLRTARARGFIHLTPSTVRLIEENEIKKGDVLTVAEIAGVQAAKRTSELIPLCHPLQLGKVDVKAKAEKGGVSVTSRVTCVDRTGVEMEALTAASVALLTVYDMCKAVDKEMCIGDIVLLEKKKK
jgi:cyclic pyranopterin phosphate synthase